ncbi:MAG: cytochrome c biogenesis protein CcdA, partial [Bacteroidota bacterium]|nr:cytochrome c biogenesis protein CcdA [Bacteroidota bacterium]
MKRKILLTVFTLIISFAAFSQVVESVKWENKSKNIDKNTAELVFNAKIAMHWHLYSQYFEDGGPVKTTFYFNESENYKLVGKMLESPEPEEVFDETFKIKVKYFSNQAVFKQKIEVLTEKDFTISGSIEYQTCQDDKCMYFNPDFEIKVNAGNGIADIEKKSTQEEITKTTQNVEEKDLKQILSINDELKESDENESEEKSLVGFFFLAFALGLAGILTPCVFPMIPMTVSFFMQGQGSRANSIIKALIFGLSIVALYTSVGLIVSLTSAGADFTTGISSHWLPNVIFFILFIAFAASFFGMFEIVLPSGLANKADKQVDKGGFLAAFFMAFTLVIVSFSCTGPIVGALLVKAAGGDVLEPLIGMFGFSLAFALPFTILAIFPGLLKKMPKSGGWMNAVKVVLGFIILAFSMKFALNIDTAYHLNILTREVYLSIWIVLFVLLGMYLLGKIKFSHDSDMPFIKVPRLLMAVASFTFALYLLPGIFGANLSAVSSLIPPKTMQNFDLTSNSNTANASVQLNQAKNICEESKYSDFLHLPYGLQGYFDYEQGMACAKKLDKPVLLEFKGHQCSNCKKMENAVWSDQLVQKKLNNEYVIIALYVDDRTKLPESEWYTSD